MSGSDYGIFIFVSRYDRVKDLASERRQKLDEAHTLHQFFRDVDDEEAWIKYVTS